MTIFDKWPTWRQILRLAKDHRYTLIIFAVFLAVYLWLTVYRHLAFHSNAFDLAIFAQTSWLISTFQEPYSTVRMIFAPADHFGPTYYLLSMGYWIVNSPIYLFILMIASALFGGLAVWLLARDILKSQAAANFLLIAYFAQIGLVQAITFDFSTTALSVGFTAWAIYFWYKQRFWPYVILMVLAIGCKEDMPVLFGAFSLLMAYKRQWKWFFTTLLFSIAWYLSVIYYIVPVLFNHDYDYNKLANPLNGLQTKEAGLREVFVQNLGLALANPLGILFAAANYATRFLKNGPGYWMNEFHYGANIAAPLIISTASGIVFFIKQTGIKEKHAATILLTMAIAIVTLVTTGPLIGRVPRPALERQVVNEVLDKIPADASVSAQNVLTPHLSSRKDIYLFPRMGLRDCNDEACELVEYVVVSEAHNAWPLTKERLDEEIAKMDANPLYSLIEHQHGVRLYQRID